MRAPAALVSTLVVAAWVSAGLAQTPALDSDVGFVDVPARRSTDGRTIEASAVGLPDERLPMVNPRCDAARRAGEVRARAMLHVYVDRALRSGRVTPTQLVAAHRVVDEDTRITGVRGLVDCGAVVRVAVPSSALEATVRGAEVTFP